MDNQTIQLRPLRDFALTDKILDPDSAVSAIDENAQAIQDAADKMVVLQNRLSAISFNPDNFTNFEYLADTLRDVIQAFGGTIENGGVSEASFHVSQDDIDAGRGTLVFTTMPLLAGNDQSNPKIAVQKNLE